MMGLREFNFREFLKKNLDFIAGIFSEISLAVFVIVIFALLTFFLIYLRSIV